MRESLERELTDANKMAVSKRALVRVGQSPTFLDYLVSVWEYRHFSYFDAKARIRGGNRKDKLGSLWYFMNPLLNGLTYYLIFGVLLRTGAGIPNFLGFFLIGLFTFQYSSRVITAGARCIDSNRGMVQAFKFPRASLALAANLREFIANIPPTIAMLLIIIVVPPGEGITWRWVLIIPSIFLLALFNFGLSMILARMIARVNDVNYFIPFMLRAWMYGSAIFFSYDRYINHPLLLDLLRINPLYNAVDIMRSSILYSTTPSFESWSYLIIVSLASLMVGAVFFWRGEESYGRQH